MSLINQPEMGDRLLLDLFIKHIRENLEAEVIKALRPVIDREIDRVVAELNPVIQSEFNVRNGRVVHQITVSRREDRQ